jgi:hypothetical protein
MHKAVEMRVVVGVHQTYIPERTLSVDIARFNIKLSNSLSFFTVLYCFPSVVMKIFAILVILGAARVLADGCVSTADVAAGKLPDPLVPFGPSQATSSCDYFGDVPFGKVPAGCADLEVIYGMV